MLRLVEFLQSVIPQSKMFKQSDNLILRILYSWFGPFPREGERYSAYLLCLSAFAAVNLLPMGALMYWGLVRYGYLIGEMSTSGNVVGGIFLFGLPLLMTTAALGSIGCLGKALLLRVFKMDRVISLAKEFKYKYEDE